MHNKIIIKGAREHNLKNISLEIPRNKLVTITGLSGSGKSSLAFDTIFAEGQRRYVESLSAYARQFLGQMEKPDVDEIIGLSPAISIDQKAHSANPRSTVATITEIYDYLRVLYARVGTPHCVKCLRPIQKLSNEEMVDVVLRKLAAGSGQLAAQGNEINDSAASRKLPAASRGSVKILAPVVVGRKGEYLQMLQDLYNSGFARVRIDGDEYRLDQRIKLSKYKVHAIEVIIDSIPISSFETQNKEARGRLADALEIATQRGNDVAMIAYPDKTEQALSSKFSCPVDGFSFPEIEPRLFSFNSPYGACQTCHGLGVEELFSEVICPVCHGDRLRPEALHVWLEGAQEAQEVQEAQGGGQDNSEKPLLTSTMKEGFGVVAPRSMSIVALTRLSIEAVADYLLTLDLNDRQKEIAGSILKEIMNRLSFMLDVGLHYLTLNRTAGTLSGGEAQRIRLASQVGSQLVGALYVLDEPTIGLHQRDNERLIQTLTQLRDLGNTVLVVEHDEDTIRASDHMIEIGPGAGVHGGEVIANGPVPAIFDDKKSLTAAYLRRDKMIPVPKNRRAVGLDSIKIRGARENNLKNIDVDIPLRRFVCITGVSGSGKSTLAYDTMYKAISKRLYGSKHTPGAHKAVLGIEYIDKAILMDQSPIGRTSRSNPATYTGAWGPIRELYASTEEARFRGYKPGRFSFNRPGGRCENCEGHGLISIEMHFLPTVYVTCDTCKGRRFDRETLEIIYNDKNIHEILEMTVEEGAKFFRDIPFVYDKLKTLNDVGLGYVKLGQAAPSLSGGEAQRVKLATELAKRSTGKTLYLLDEPTTGLHFHDVKQLLEVLHTLVDKGNTIVVIEHNLDVIKTADWIIDMGPEGGDKGGTVVKTGTPEEIAWHKPSYTGQYLKGVLSGGAGSGSAGGEKGAGGGVEGGQ
ncbi:excinuclease ABC subunit UvrA [Candidatus Uhrbacteria bacterium]|nr:excinuclease ABC subunit UvrA [Candidatus Uhrbacteria bacterium]